MAEEAGETRQPPPMVLMRLAHTTSAHPDFIDWMVKAAADGFGLSQPGDEDLSAEEWASIAGLRYSALERAYFGGDAHG